MTHLLEGAVKKAAGWWLPAHEEHLIDWMEHPKNRTEIDGRLTYQLKKIEAVLRYVSAWRTAVDVGAHVGLWSWHLVKRFDFVHAFEPMDVHRACFRLNVPSANAFLYPTARGAVSGGSVALRLHPGSSGDTHVVREAQPGDVQVPLKALDDYDLQNVDLIKADCEGYELAVMRGAYQTIERCRPVIIVEQKAKTLARFGEQHAVAVEFLQQLRYDVREVLSGDYILTPRT